ncbi:MAG: TMEM175 family protein [Betaproteobacteria bacterium]
MGTGRLEAFSDGVLAVIITIMVLEMKAPHDGDPKALLALLPVLLSYVLSFVYVGIYWNNHHHLFHVIKHVDGRVLWANLHLLFWLSLIPFATSWMGENHFSTWPTVMYGVILLMSGVAYELMTRSLRHANPDAALAGHAAAKSSKGVVSILIYLAAIPLAFYNVLLADAMFVLVAIMWFIPDRRIEQALGIQPR